jgi:hypothetical protein
MKTLLIAAASLATLAAPVAASAAPAWGHGGYANGHGYGGYRGDYRGNDGAAVAAGLFGFVLGAAVTHNQPAYTYDGYGYDYPPYATRCHWETRAYEGAWGRVHYQQVEVCR